MKGKFKIFINEEKNLLRIVITKNGQVEYLFLDTPSIHPEVGSIYLGKIENTVSGLGASFVSLGEGKTGFLPFEDEEIYMEEEFILERDLSLSGYYKKGEEVIVQITRPGDEKKKMKLTKKILLPGRFLILMPGISKRGISKKITDLKERKRLFEIAKEIVPENFGFIIRTAAQYKEKDYILKEAKHLLGVWKKIIRYSKVKKAPSPLWEEIPLYLRIIRDYVNEEFDEVRVDNEFIYKEIKKYVDMFVPELNGKVKLYKEGVPLFLRMGIENQLEKFLTRKVYLHSGGYLLIEEGETLTAIDVNTGTSEKENIKETIFNTNMEAAREIPRQIRVRNISGLIIVDFIDMKEKKEKEMVFERFKENLREDKVKIKLLNFSELGLVEMSRKRTNFSLKEILFRECEECKGTGKIKSVPLIFTDLKKEIWFRTIHNPDVKKYRIEATTELYNYIMENNLLPTLCRKKKIEVIENTFLEEPFRIIEL
ncbi:Rne/Rng family ribonuclease [bacterium]|nr:Rne/Rng family ribonuclease [bacterium]